MIDSDLYTMMKNDGSDFLSWILQKINENMADYSRREHG